ncbi:MAG: OmpA family protein, partial [Gammaproteobacteria bacterium]|nr:OmpA family protein [Gammaproteobacteria bacterium]
DVPVYFTDGYTTATNKITEVISSRSRRISDLQQQTSAQQTQLASLETQVTELETRLGGTSKERMALAQRLEQEAETKAKIEEIENLFSPEEATVLRKGDDIVIRMVGLQFGSGKAVIETERFGLLSKVETAMNRFPSSKIVIEGHTDSFGGDKINEQLSTKRAEAVKSYLIANTQWQPNDIDAVGFGENEPVANNETSEGRAKNRRIDLVLKSTTTIPASATR